MERISWLFPLIDHFNYDHHPVDDLTVQKPLDREFNSPESAIWRTVERKGERIGVSGEFSYSRGGGGGGGGGGGREGCI